MSIENKILQNLTKNSYLSNDIKNHFTNESLTSNNFERGEELNTTAVTYTDLFLQNLIFMLDFFHDFYKHNKTIPLLDYYKNNISTDRCVLFFEILLLIKGKKPIENAFFDFFLNKHLVENTATIIQYATSNNYLTFIIDNHSPGPQFNARTLGYFFDSATKDEVETIDLNGPQIIWSRSPKIINKFYKVTSLSNYNNFIRENFSDIDGKLKIQGRIIGIDNFNILIPEDFLQIKNLENGQYKLLFFDNPELLLFPQWITSRNIATLLDKTVVQISQEVQYIIDLVFTTYNDFTDKYNMIIPKHKAIQIPSTSTYLEKKIFIIQRVNDLNAAFKNKCSRNIMLYSVLLISKVKTLGDYIMIREASIDNSLIFVTSDKFAGFQAGLLGANYMIYNQTDGNYYRFLLKDEGNETFSCFNGLNEKKKDNILQFFEKIRNRLFSRYQYLSIFTTFTPQKMNMIHFNLNFNLSPIQYMYLFENIQNNIPVANRSNEFTNINNNPHLTEYFHNSKSFKYIHPDANVRNKPLEDPVPGIFRMHSGMVYYDIYTVSDLELYKYRLFLIKKRFNTVFSSYIESIIKLKNHVLLFKNNFIYLNNIFSDIQLSPNVIIQKNQLVSNFEIYNTQINEFLEIYKNLRKIIKIQKTNTRELKTNRKNIYELIHIFLIRDLPWISLNGNTLLTNINNLLLKIKKIVRLLNDIKVYQSCLNRLIDCITPRINANNIKHSWKDSSFNIFGIILNLIRVQNIQHNTNFNTIPEINLHKNGIKQKIIDILSDEPIKQYVIINCNELYKDLTEQYEIIEDYNRRNLLPNSNENENGTEVNGTPQGNPPQVKQHRRSGGGEKRKIKTKKTMKRL